MNIKRLLLAIPAAFLFVFFTDFLIHGIWLKPDYTATAEIWRSEAGMQAHFPCMLAAYLLLSVTFCMIWAKGFAHFACIRCACIYGLMMALFSQVNTLMMYVVLPMPGMIAVKWFGSALAQGLLLGILVFFVYKPKPETAGPVCTP